MERLFDLDSQLLLDMALTAAGVFVLFMVLSCVLFTPIRELLEKRRAGLEAEREQTRSRRVEAERYLEQSETKWKRADAQIRATMQEAQRNAREQERKGKEAGKQAAEQLLCRAQKEMLQERERNQKELKQEILFLAAAMAEKIVTVQMDDREQERLFRETLERIGETTWQDASQGFMQKPGTRQFWTRET